MQPESLQVLRRFIHQNTREREREREIGNILLCQLRIADIYSRDRTTSYLSPSIKPSKKRCVLCCFRSQRLDLGGGKGKREKIQQKLQDDTTKHVGEVVSAINRELASSSLTITMCDYILIEYMIGAVTIPYTPYYTTLYYLLY